MVGLGGGDVRPEHLGEILEEVGARAEAGAPIFMEVG